MGVRRGVRWVIGGVVTVGVGAAVVVSFPWVPWEELAWVAGVVAAPVAVLAWRFPRPVVSSLPPRRVLAPRVQVSSPTSLLRAEAEVVPFAGRDRLVEELIAWCVEDPQRVGVWLVTGRGGEGKTRLGVELARRVQGLGWWAGRVDEYAQADGVFGAAGSARSVLLVVDYAETRTGQVTELVKYATQWVGDKRRVRVVLLARAAGEWWEDLCASPALVSWGEPRKTVLEPLTQAGVTATELWREAVTRFAHRLGDIPGYEGVAWDQIAHHLTRTEQPTWPVGVSVLAVQADALARLLQAGSPDADEKPVATHKTGWAAVAEVLLRHERRYWMQTAAAYGIRLDPQVLRWAVTAASLWGADSHEEASAVLMALEGVRDLSESDRVCVERWLADLYPAGPHRRWGVLQPDRLAEHLTAQVLTTPGGVPVLLTPIAQVASPDQARHALTVLARACTDHPHLTDLLRELVINGPGTLAVAAVSVVLETEHPAPLLEALTSRINQGSVDLGGLEQLHDAIPQRTQRLADLALAVTNALVHLYRDLSNTDPDTYQPRLAASLNNLAVRLAALGQWEKALTVAEEATGLYRELVAVRPDAFTPDLASSLNNLSNNLATLGRSEDALAAIEEATSLYRDLVTARSDIFTADLASSLNNLSLRLAGMGKRKEALAAIEEATSLYRGLAAAHPDAFTSDLANSLHNLAAQLADLDRREEGLAAVEEAVALRRKLAATRPDAFIPDLAMSLNNLSNRLASVERWDEALGAIEEAVTLYRGLVDAQPEAFTPDLAASLSNLSLRLAGMGRWGEALTSIEEAIGLYRDLVDAFPQVFRSDLVRALTILTTVLTMTGDKERVQTTWDEIAALTQETTSL